jgi:hypothetical protein
MVENELLERVRGGRYVVTESIEGRYDRGVLHSNISDEGGIDVIDRITGDTIGRIEGAPGNRVEIGGAERSVVRIDNDRMLTDAARDGQPARFRPSARPAVSQALARAVVEALGVPSDALALVSLPGSWSLLHGLGTVGSLFLSKILASASRAISIEEATPYTLTLAAPLKVVPTMPPDAVLRFVTKRLESLEKMTNPGPWKKSVPDPLRIAATWRGSGIDDVVSFLASCRLVTLPPADENLRELLLAL